MEKLLKVENIVKKFPGTIALKGVSTELCSGEIHAVVGENGAGKSTLMNVISGGLQPDDGDIILLGSKVSFATPKDAQLHGIGLVHQELALFPELTVAENIFVERLPMKKGLIDFSKLNTMAEEILRNFESSIKPNQLLKDLSVSQQQIVEIAKVVSTDCEIIIFDEPTSSLNEEEANQLFALILKLKEMGKGIFYISHKLSEIFKMCDRITVLRDGNYIVTRKVAETNEEEIVQDMIGRNLMALFPDKSSYVGREELLAVNSLTAFNKFKDISFTLKKGEILGIVGLVGSGRTEIARGICGIDPVDSGSIHVIGKKIKTNKYSDALKNGLCYLTENRKTDGLFLDMDITDNMIAPQVDAFSKNFMLNRLDMKKVTEKYKKILDIKYSNSYQLVNSLSGGNQQKIMLGKILATNPKVVILDEPTRGIDVGAKVEIHTVLRELSNEGIGIIVISSEMTEVVGLCDRVVIVREGRLVDDISGVDVTQDNIVQSISQLNKEREEDVYVQK